MIEEVKKRLIAKYQSSLNSPYNGTLKDWVKKYVVLPNTYAIPGNVDLNISPYLLQPSIDLLDPKIRQINFIAGVQTGKSLLSELYIPYLIANNPGNILRMHQNDDAAKFFNTTRLAPILNNCAPVKSFLKSNRFAVKKDTIDLPHMNIRCTGPSENYLHGISVRTVILDEAHIYEPGVINKAIARTNAFAQNRKILICSQPNSIDTDLYKHYMSGNIYEWQWCCPNCKQYQPYEYTKKREDGTFSGLNWETILNSDGETTNIAYSARTAYLECHNCRHRITDTIVNRRYLNDTGKYVCIKNDGDSAIRSYTWSSFVNIGLSFEYFAIQGMQAKRTMKTMGLKDEWINFINQVYGRFYKAEPIVEQSKIKVIELDSEEQTKDSVKIMTVDVQRKGNVKYYVIRQWLKNGMFSRRIEHGIVREWDEIDAVAKKHNIHFPCVGIDSGDGERTLEIYGECVKHGKVIKLPNGTLKYICWTALKGDQKPFYKHKDGIMRVYSEEGSGDCQFPVGHKLKGIPAPLYLWSNYSIKTIMSKLRDNEMKNVTWSVDKKDPEYDQSMYSEGLVEVINKKTGIPEMRWIQKYELNHWFDCECMNLTLAIMFGLFSPSNIDNDLVAKLSKDEFSKDNKDK